MVEFDQKGFLSHTGTRRAGKFSKWKEKGSTIGFIHPTLYINGRRAHSIIPAVISSEERGEEGVNKRFNCAAQPEKMDGKVGKDEESICPLCMLVKFAEQEIEGGANPTESILDSGNKDKVSYSLAGLACQLGKGRWLDELGFARMEYVFAWVPAKAADRADGPVEIMTEGEGLKTALQRVMNSKIDDYGEEKGNLRKHPYPIKLIHNKQEKRPAYKYDAQPVDKELAPIDDEIKDIMHATGEDLGIDLKSMCVAGDSRDMMTALESSWVSRSIPFAKFKEFFSGNSSAKEERREDKPRDEQKDESSEEPSSGKKFCPACGVESDGGKFCQECGEQLKQGSASPKPEQPVGRGLVRCPRCEKEVEPMKLSKRCPDCGDRLESDVPY